MTTQPTPISPQETPTPQPPTPPASPAAPAAKTPQIEAIPAFLAFPEDLFLVGRDGTSEEIAAAMRLPRHPLYDQRVHRSFKESRVLSIMDYGVQAPVKVRKNVLNNRLEVVDGRGRIIDSREANRRLVALGKEKKRVRCIPESTTDDARLFGISIVCNSMRDDDDPDTEAEKIRRYLAEYKCTKEQAAETFGCSTQTIDQRLKLLQLSPKVRAVVRSRDLPVGQALRLLVYSFEEQDAALERMLRVKHETEARLRREEFKAMRAAEDGREKQHPIDQEDARERRANKRKTKKSTRELNKIVSYLEANARSHDADIVLATLNWILGKITDEDFGALGDGLVGKILEAVNAPKNMTKRQQVSEALKRAADGEGDALHN